MAAQTEPERDHVAALVRQLFLEAGQLGNVVSSRTGLHLKDIQAVQVLDATAGDPPTVSQLGAQLGLSSAAVTGLVDRLETAGLVERVRDTRDRRKVFVHLSAKSKEVGRQLMRPVAQRIERAVRPLDHADLGVVVEFLERLLEPEAGQERGTKLKG